MAIQLFEHNQRAYIAVEDMLARVGKAAVIHPTGTGKSYIAFKLIESHPDASFLWLSPSDYIYKTQKEALQQSDPGMSLENVRFFTYAKLMQFAAEELTVMEADYIILDEFHRCGAERWGESVQTLIQTHPDAKLLGLSATNIRYLDNQRDIARELFDGYVASEMTLGECIVRGILPKPRYVTTVFKYQQDLEKYQARIARVKTPALRDIHEKYYNALRRALEQADGLDVILKKHITAKKGKYLVFCSGYEHIQEMKKLTEAWFRAINPEVHMYTAYSSDPQTSTAFQQFKADSSDALKLLFCINMLNEGVHVKGISGVILFRPTISPIIYKQQIGRALTSGDREMPLILDVVNNFEGLYSISTIQQEMDEAVYRMTQNNESDSIVVEKFAVEAQVPDCVSLFAALEDSLSAPWNHYFSAAEAYYRENGHLNVPKNYDTPEGLHLGQWLCTQRALYRNSRYHLSPEQIERLESIGMQWQRHEDQRWDMNYEAAVRFYETHGHLRVAARYETPEGLKLGRWITNIRQKYHATSSGALTEEQIRQMEAIGMVWDENEAQWQHHFGCAAEYYDTHGNLDVPISYMTEDGFALGRWLTQMRTARRGKRQQRLTEEQIAQLDSIGMSWEKRGDTTWMQGYEQAKGYYDEYGSLQVPSNYKTENGFALGKWISRQRYAYRNPEKSNATLTKERIALLQQIGITLDKQSMKDKGAANVSKEHERLEEAS